MSIGYLITSQDDYNYCWQLGVGFEPVAEGTERFQAMP